MDVRLRIVADIGDVVGALLASALALSFSPLTPLGPVRRVYPSRRIAFDWTVVGVGARALVVVLVAVILAYGLAPNRVARRASRHPGASFGDARSGTRDVGYPSSAYSCQVSGTALSS
jgi:uncharacterized BrkB/YihY/UPF0761 family membrane protein